MVEMTKIIRLNRNMKLFDKIYYVAILILGLAIAISESNAWLFFAFFLVFGIFAPIFYRVLFGINFNFFWKIKGGK